MKLLKYFSSAVAACLFLSAAASAQTTQPGTPPSPTPGKMPDLIITRVQSLDQMPGMHLTKAKVFVKNQGTAPAGACKLKVRVLDGHGNQAVHFADVPALAVGAEIGVLISTGPHVHPRSCRFYVDATKIVVESNENNNTRDLKIP